MTDTFNTFALVLLLAAPGPTNALLLAYGATRPPREAATALTAELAGYGLALAVLVCGLLPVVQGHPLLLGALKLTAVAFLILTALRLWRSGGAPDLSTPGGGARAIFMVSLTNPKSLIIALMLWPAGGHGLICRACALLLAAFAGLMLASLVPSA